MIKLNPFMMKKVKLLIGTVILSAMILISCQKEDPVITYQNPIVTPTPTLNTINAFFGTNLESEKQTISIDLSTQTSLTGTNGTILYFSSNTFEDMNGNTVSGVIEIEMIETQSNKDMLWLNRPTTTTNGQLLVSGGIVYVNVTQNGNQLSINDNAPIQASIPSDDYIPMDYFVGTTDNDGRFGWEIDDDTVTTNTADTTNWNPVGNGLFSFDFEIDSIGWINCDYFYNSSDPLTGVQVELPDSFNGNNSAVFIYYNTINSVASLYDSDNDGVFDLGASYSTPVGMDISFIVLSENSTGDFYYTIINSTIVNGHYQTISSSDMMGPVSAIDVQNAINMLP